MIMPIFYPLTETETIRKTAGIPVFVTFEVVDCDEPYYRWERYYTVNWDSRRAITINMQQCCEIKGFSEPIKRLVNETPLCWVFMEDDSKYLVIGTAEEVVKKVEQKIRVILEKL